MVFNIKRIIMVNISEKTKKSIVSSDVQQEIIKQVDIFNKKYMNADCVYTFNIKGKFIYLMYSQDNSVENVCRLTYGGDVNNMDFAIYKYSTEKYDPSEFFPGIEYVDGTVTGAMKAGLKAYPI